MGYLNKPLLRAKFMVMVKEIGKRLLIIIIEAANESSELTNRM